MKKLHAIDKGKRYLLGQLSKFLNFVKFEHTLFSLPLIYSGVFLAAKTQPEASLLLLVLTAATGARTVALTLNRIIDREIDRRNPRTAIRELPSGKISLQEAMVVLFIGLTLYLGSAALISTFCLILSPLPLAVFTLYPYMKRFTPLAHFGVGLGLAMAPLGGWIAVEQSLSEILPGALLALFTMLWVSGFDIIYSTLDEMFDRENHLYSFSSKYGRQKAIRISGILHVFAFASLVLLFTLYLRALAALPFLLVSGYLLYLEQKRADDVEMAFFKINVVLGFVVLGMVVAGVYFP